MDTLTHALSGALLARAAIPDRGLVATRRDCTMLGFAAAAFPDTDVLFSLVSPLAYLYHHRGITHSVAMLPFWALVLAWLWSRLRRNPAGFKCYFLVSAGALGIHILGDLITSFGTIVFAPLSDARIRWDTTFIIDLWFSGIVVAGLLASGWVARPRIPAVAALLVLTGYVSFQWVQQRQAVDVGTNYAKEHGLDAIRTSALPRPVSPFNWMVIVETPERYHYAFVNLRRERPVVAGADAGFIRRLDAAYLPASSARWEVASRFGDGQARALGEAAWGQSAFAFFRWFSAYPVLAQVERGNPGECVWFQDLRFLTPGRDTWPFRYGMCRRAGGEWRPYQARDSGERIELKP